MDWLRHVRLSKLEIGLHGNRDVAIHVVIDFIGPERARALLILLANFDIAPTILALEGVKAPDSMRGRVIGEAFAKSPRAEPKARMRSVRVSRDLFCASIDVSEVGKRTYVDRGHFRPCRPTPTSALTASSGLG